MSTRYIGDTSENFVAEIVAGHLLLTEFNIELSNGSTRYPLWENEPANLLTQDDDLITLALADNFETVISDVRDANAEQVRNDTTDWGGHSVPDSRSLWHNVYVLPLAPDVEAYLSDYPFLTPVLDRAIPIIERLFPNSRVSLRVVNHEEDGWRHLFATVLTERPLDEAIDLVERLDDEWYLDEEPIIRERMTFDVQCPDL